MFGGTAFILLLLNRDDVSIFLMNSNAVMLSLLLMLMRCSNYTRITTGIKHSITTVQAIYWTFLGDFLSAIP